MKIQRKTKDQEWKNRTGYVKQTNESLEFEQQS